MSSFEEMINDLAKFETKKEKEATYVREFIVTDNRYQKKFLIVCYE